MTDLERIRSLLQHPEPVTWVFTGDSITHGALHTFGWRSYPEHFAERVRWEMRRYRDVVINTGISGDKIPGLTADLEHRVLRFKPTVVSIMMGMNDSTAGPEGVEDFRSAYTALIERLRDTISRICILLHTPNPVTSFTHPYLGVSDYAQVVREVAEQQGAALVDHHRVWSERPVALTSLLEDGTLHPNHFGHILFAQTIFKLLQADDPSAPTCRIRYPEMRKYRSGKGTESATDEDTSSPRFRAIGTNKTAECIETAVKLFPFADPQLQGDARRDYLRKHCMTPEGGTNWSAELIQLGDRVNHYSATHYTLLAQYIRAHLNEIRNA